MVNYTCISHMVDQKGELPISNLCIKNILCTISSAFVKQYVGNHYFEIINVKIISLKCVHTLQYDYTNECINLSTEAGILIRLLMSSALYDMCARCFIKSYKGIN